MSYNARRKRRAFRFSAHQTVTMLQQRLYNLRRQKEVLERSLASLDPASEHAAVRRQEAEIKMHIGAINDDIVRAMKDVDFHINRIMGEGPRPNGKFPLITWT